jgi:hypothetical protein
MALLSFVDSPPRAYRLKAGNADPPISTMGGTSPALVRDVLLPQRTAKWTNLLAWTALTLRHCEEDESWQDFFVSAKELARGRPLAEIALMARVADNTVTAYLSRAHL